MHFLDLIMYFVTCGILWGILALISGGEFTEEMGGALIGMPIWFLYTIFYIVAFAFWPDWNWADFDYNAMWAWFKW